MRSSLALGVLVAVVLALHAGSALLKAHPGFTDAYYYHDVAQRLARGDGLTVDFAWSLLESSRPDALPVPSHRFWMPASTALQAAGIVAVGGVLGPFRAAQLATLLVVALVPLLAYAASRSVGAGERAGLFAALVVGLGGIFGAFWATLDSYAIAAVAGTAFFLAFGRAAVGRVRWGVVAGLAVGALFLTRGEGALFGLALLALLARPSTRRAGLAGSAVALAIGLAWLARDLALRPQIDLLSRTVLLLRYDEFFGLEEPTLGAFVAAWPEVLAAKAAALGTNALTFATTFLFIGMVPLGLGVRAHRRLPAVRAWVALALVVYLAESLVFTLHSTRGSYIHSLAAFFPFGVALAVDGATAWLATRERPMARTVAATSLAGIAAFSAFGEIGWHANYDPPYLARVAAASGLYPAGQAGGPLFVLDAAAWRWSVDVRGPFIVSPPRRVDADCLAGRGVRMLVLEPVHFAAWDDLYSGRSSGPWTLRADVGGVRVYDYDPRSAPICPDLR